MKKTTHKKLEIIRKEVECDFYICEICLHSFEDPIECEDHEKLHVKPVYESNQVYIYQFENENEFLCTIELYKEKYTGMHFQNFSLPGFYCFCHNPFDIDDVYCYPYAEFLDVFEKELIELTEMIKDIKNCIQKIKS